jgi:hypothetical protein
VRADSSGRSAPRGRLILPFAVAVLLVALLAVPAGAQTPVTATATADRATASVGDRITYQITVTSPPGAQITPPGDTQAFGQFDILERRSPQQQTLPDGRTETQVTFVVAAFRATGPLPLTSPAVPYTLPDGSSGTAPVSPITITVQSVLPEQGPADIRDLKPQLIVPGAPTRVPEYLYALAAAAVALPVLTVIFLRLRRRSAQAPGPAPSLLPEDIARAELDEIAAMGLLANGDYRTYHRMIAGVVRRYLSARYHFPGFARTTTELQMSMVDSGVDRWQARLVSGLLRECDAVVYAGYLPASARADSNLTTAYEIVEMTRPDNLEPIEQGTPFRNGKVGAA